MLTRCAICDQKGSACIIADGYDICKSCAEGAAELMLKLTPRPENCPECHGERHFLKQLDGYSAYARVPCSSCQWHHHTRLG